MQNLMWGLTKELSKNYMLKVFADYQENHQNFDEQVSFSLKELVELKFLENIEKLN